MKYLSYLLACMLVLSCEPKGKQVGDYTSYGKEISADDAITQEAMLTQYEAMQPTDTVEIKFKSQIQEVCQMKGCWVKMKLNPTTESMVKFGHDDFFIPKDSDGREAIVSGKAFIKEVSVAEQQHYAEDAGKSKEEIAAITSPQKEYYFIADGILVQ